MGNALFDVPFETFVDSVPALIVGAVVLVLVAVAFYWLWRRRRIKPAQVAKADLDLDVRSLNQDGPSPDVARLDFYNMPVRVAAVVIAPVGRDRPTPSVDELQQLIDAIVPGMENVVDSHGPAIRLWPAQLSVQGFNQAFFNNVPLPGIQGKGSPWCSLAGKFNYRGHSFVAGLVCRSADANNVGQVIVQHDAQWLDILRLP